MAQAEVKGFIEKLKQTEFLRQLAPSLALTIEGDWEAVVQIANQYGFHFTVDELKAEAMNHPGFFKGNGKYPGLGWEKTTLDT